MTKIAMPLRFVDGALVTAEEGTPEALQAAVVTACRCSPGDRLANPEFGTILPLFDPTSTDVVEIVLDQVREFVPEADSRDIVAAMQAVPR